MTDSQIFAGAAVLGAPAGMRSMSSPAIVCGLAHAGVLPVHNKQLEILAASGFRGNDGCSGRRGADSR